MPRTKTGVKRRRRHKKIRQLAKGFKGFRGHTFRGAKEGLLHALTYQYRDRRRIKREMRRLWIMRLNAALREHGWSYSRFIPRLQAKKIALNRKILSLIALHDRDTFAKIVKKVLQE